jgi:glucosyl-3-phosphoglycerate synthase
MSVDIAKTLFRKLASNGTSFSIEMVRSLKATYLRIAEDFIERYYADAMINGFRYDRHKEEEMVDLFAKNIYKAGEEFLQNPLDHHFIPSWQRIFSAFPEFPKMFYEAVEADNA